METRYLICTSIYIFYTKDIIFLIQHIKLVNMSTSRLINCMAAGQKYVASVCTCATIQNLIEILPCICLSYMHIHVAETHRNYDNDSMIMSRCDH